MEENTDNQKIEGSQDDVKKKHYLEFLGAVNPSYYLAKFILFDNRGGGMIPSWNWPAFFFSGYWLLYRKMYGLGITIIILQMIPVLNFFISIPIMIIFGVFGNSLYHKHVNGKLIECLLLQDEGRISFALNQSGGVHMWVKWASIALFVFMVFLSAVVGAASN